MSRCGNERWFDFAIGSVNTDGRGRAGLVVGALLHAEAGYLELNRQERQDAKSNLRGSGAGLESTLEFGVVGARD